MRRFLALLILLTFGLNQAVAAPLALCQHADAHAHQAALASSDHGESSAAHAEDVAAAAKKKGLLADAAGTVGNIMLPNETLLIAPAAAERLATRPAVDARRSDRAIAPLLEPPAA